MRFVILAAVLSLLVLPFSACTSMPHPEGKPMPRVTFQHLTPLKLDVAKVNIFDHSGGFAGELDVFDRNRPEFTIDVAAKMQQYLKRRFVAGEDKHPFNPSELTIEIQRAEIKHERAIGDRGGFNYFDIGGFDDYIIHYDVVFTAFNRKDYARKSVGIRLTRKVSVSEHSSVARREEKHLAAFEDIMKSFDTRAVEIVRGELGL